MLFHMENSESHQNKFLLEYQQNQRECTFITINGVHIKGIIEAFDKFVVLLRSPNGKSIMIYKHAISTIKSYTEK
jgi:host factor-I protein